MGNCMSKDIRESKIFRRRNRSILLTPGLSPHTHHEKKWGKMCRILGIKTREVGAWLKIKYQENEESINFFMDFADGVCAIMDMLPKS